MEVSHSLGFSSTPTVPPSRLWPCLSPLAVLTRGQRARAAGRCGVTTEEVGLGGGRRWAESIVF